MSHKIDRKTRRSDSVRRQQKYQQFVQAKNGYKISIRLIYEFIEFA